MHEPDWNTDLDKDGTLWSAVLFSVPLGIFKIRNSAGLPDGLEVVPIGKLLKPSPGDLKLVFDRHHAIDFSQGFLRHLFFEKRKNGSVDGDVSGIVLDIHPMMIQMRIVHDCIVQLDR